MSDNPTQRRDPRVGHLINSAGVVIALVALIWQGYIARTEYRETRQQFKLQDERFERQDARLAR